MGKNRKQYGTKITEVDDFRPSSRKSYSALKIRVKESSVTINKITIYYEGGQT
ncbi:hypothetical protein [Flavobacterium sp. M31R6]|uniref:hypothetical protein n=1 Tax=Flavobacterium sp. M31R6 TaxID=2739062 RepID=UPI00156A363E|nr:hypothetical protein [Flavobacterium sp. M31R6]QKJ64158.1 hypothetical protein HQN62_13795 [Flavobacterium sp. M31R6]